MNEPQKSKLQFFFHISRDSKKLAVATSNASLHVFNLDDKGGFTELSGEKICGIDEQQLCGIRFASNNNNNLFVASVDKISLFDLRSNQKSVQIFQNSDASPKKLFTCFDLNADGSIICAGTEQSSNEAYLSFFDVRENSSLTTYTDSHQDDLTQVKFHSKKRNVLASGSTDGLINIFNISESCEDDALESSLNTESSIQTINWHPKNTMQTDDNNDPSDYLSCITHTNDFQFFDVEESELVFKILREDITKAIQRKLVSDCYVINSHTDLNGDSFLLAGSNFDSGQCLRSLTIQDSSLVPRNNLIDNKQIVRCSIFNAKVRRKVFFSFFSV